MKNKNVIIGVLLTIIVVLVVAIGYVLLNKEANTKTYISNYSNIPKNSDLSDKLSGVSLLTDSEKKTNFKNLEKSLNGVKYNLNCSVYEKRDTSDKDSYCFTMSVKVDNLFTLDNIIATEGLEGNALELYKTDTYYIALLYHGNSVTVEIFDLNGKLVLTDDNGFDGINPVIVDNVLYYATYNSEGSNTFSYVDLEKKELKVVEVENQTSSEVTTTTKAPYTSSQTINGENVELSNVINNYVKSHSNLQDLKNAYKITKEFHVIDRSADYSGANSGEYYKIVVYYYYNNKKIDIISESDYDYTKDDIKNMNDYVYNYVSESSFKTSKFNDTKSSDYYYLIGTEISSMDSMNGMPNSHYIVDKDFKVLASLNELNSSLIRYKNGGNILDNTTSYVSLNNNKVQYVARNVCDFVVYETYLENGNLKKNIIKNISENELIISGEKC